MAKSTTTRKRRASTGSAWSVKGVTHETRAAVKKAAKRDGMTLGAWVDRALMNAAKNNLQGSTEVVVITPDQVFEQLQQLSQKVDDLAAPKPLMKKLFG